MTAPSGHSADAWGERLPRSLGLWSAVAVLVGITIGSGIFRVPATVAAHLQDPGPVMLAWVLGGLITLFGALTIAELAGALPRSGGIFAYVLEGFGPLPAFLVGWAELAVVRAAALGGISTIFAEYLGYFIAMTQSQVRYCAATTIVAVALLNYIGVGRAAAVMNFATLLKFIAVAALGLLAFSAGNGSAENFTPLWSSTVGASLLGTALIPILWTYDGWSNLSFVGGEVRDPQRSLPLALIIGTVAVIVIYMLINLAFIYLLPLPQMAGAQFIASTAAANIPLLGGFGASIVAAIVMISTFSSLNGSIMTGPRVFFAMAERGLFFRSIARVSPRFHTPSHAILLTAALGVIYVLQNDFAQLADKFILGAWPSYALAVAAVFVLRRKRPDLQRPYRTWGYPVVPALFLLASVGMIANALWTDPANTAITFGIILVGVPVYFIWQARAARRIAVTE
ncbi:amino acid permease [Peristeroidobacter soli]|uniref:amino acid permease n=1 Tax=Peristeroidobacter soli TaxID=2497877 RepID=UPI00101BF5A7|nr:amino acid permease [Peristeroidobacter soli]